MVGESDKKLQALLNDGVGALLQRLRLADLQAQTSPDKLVLLVARIRGVRIEIYPNDHNPPHFHIKVNGGEHSASYRIDTFERLAGKLPSHLEREAMRWARDNQDLLWDCWRRMRPKLAVAGNEMSQ